MEKQLVLALALAASTMITVVAQDKPPQAPPPAAQPAPSTVGRQVPLKVQLTLSRFVGEKKLSSTPYMLGVLTNAQKTSLRMGVQVPVNTTVYAAKSDGGPANIPQNSYSYRDVGTNVDCEAQDVGGGLFKLVLTIEDSAIHLDRAPDSPQERQMARDVPAFRSFRSSFSTILHDGQSMQYASATDPISGEIMKIDVLLTLAK
jgi:hypothetical protein